MNHIDSNPADEPKNLATAYLQCFLDDQRFDAVLNSLPDDLLDKFYSRIVKLKADRDEWKIVCENLEEDLAKVSDLLSGLETCNHKFYYFGTEQKRRRCNNCYELEPLQGHAQDAPKTDQGGLQ